jgi:hypothetical protein
VDISSRSSAVMGIRIDLITGGGGGVWGRGRGG